jgi:hypothetical protein
MIRVEGIPVVAARLAAELKSTKTVEHSTRFRQQRIRPSLSQSLNIRPGPRATGECTRVRIAEKEKGNAAMETRSNIFSVAQNSDASTSGRRSLCGPA